MMRVDLRKLQSQEDACVSRIVNKQAHPHQYHHQPQHQLPYNSHHFNSPAHLWPSGHLQQHQNLINTSLHNDTSFSETSTSFGSSQLTNLLASRDCPADRHASSAWTDNRSHSRSLPVAGTPPKKGRDKQDLTVQEVSSQDDSDARSGSLLDSESVYLPVAGESPVRPFTSPCRLLQHQSRAPAGSQSSSAASGSPAHISAVTSSSVASPATISSVSSPNATTSRPQTSPETKYESRERRVIRPLNQELIKAKLKSQSPVSVPQASNAEPATHTPRSDRPSTAASQDYDMSLDTSYPTPLPAPSSATATSNSSAVPLAKVSLIHRVADSKRSARQLQENMRHTPPPTGSNIQPSQIPTLGQQQQQPKGSRGRMKGLDSNRQAELSKLVKCQQHADRLNQQQKDRLTQGIHLSSDSGFLSRPASDAVFTDYGQDGNTAATLIQSVWRGFWAREHSLDVVSVRKEIRARRAEDHIVLLRADLDRHKKLYSEEKRLRTLQMEAIRCLYHEVQQLKLQMQNSAASSRPGTADSTMSSMSNAGPPSTGTGSTFNDLQRTAELERRCESLQSQVSSLKDTLQSVTKQVFHQQDSMELNSWVSSSETDHLNSVQVLDCNEGQVPGTSSDTQGTARHWSSIPHSLSPYPSEEEYFRQVPHHGVPTPPRNLSLQHKGEQSALLTWLPSYVGLDHTSESKSSHVAGYRVFINDHLKGTVSSQRTSALVCGLYPTATYKFCVRAVSNQGESYESNVVIARLARGSERQRLSDSSDSDVLPDSDKDHDSTDTTGKRRMRKRENRKHRKARSPRSEKKPARASKEVVEESPVEGQGEKGQPESSRGQNHPHHAGHSPVPGILTQPKLHKHRRTSSKEQSELSSLQSDSNPSTPSRPEHDSRPPSRSTPPPSQLTPPPSQPTPPLPRSTPTPTKELAQGSGPAQPDVIRHRRAGSPARDLSFRTPSPSTEKRGGDRSSPGSQNGDRRMSGTPPVLEDAPETPLVLTETFTIDKAKSFLHNLKTPHNSAAVPDEGSSDVGGNAVKGYSKKRHKDQSGDGAEAAVPVKERMSPDRMTGGGSQSEHVVGEDGARIRTHRRNRSRDLNTPTSMDDVRKEEEAGGGREKERCNTPVLDGRKRTNSRPSSPMIFEGPALKAEQRDPESFAAEVSRRMTTAENLAQRFGSRRKSPSPINMSGGREQEEGEKKSPQYENRSRKQSPSSDSLPDSQEEAPRPVLLKYRTLSVGSESDLVSAVTERRDTKVSSLLSELESITIRDAAALQERAKRLRKRSSEEEQRRHTGRTRHISESDDTSDPGSHLPPRAPAASDSSSGSHSDDNKSRHHRHRRSPSDQRPLTTSGYSSDQVSGRPTHSPIIMEGASRKSSNSVRRNASFHALLPSRPHDSQPSPAPEDMAAGGSTATIGSHREEVTSPQESQGNPRCSIRSRSPSPGRNRQPVLSGAHLKRHTPEPGKPAS